jgi:hypothetical protein
MKVKNRLQDQFQLIPEAEMPFNLAGETLPPEPAQQPEPTDETNQPHLIP